MSKDLKIEALAKRYDEENLYSLAKLVKFVQEHPFSDGIDCKKARIPITKSIRDYCELKKWKIYADIISFNPIDINDLIHNTKIELERLNKRYNDLTMEEIKVNQSIKDTEEKLKKILEEKNVIQKSK